MDCLFCKIAHGEINSESVYEDDNIIAFKDINPQAPTHILIIPKKHISTLNDIDNADTLLIGQLTIAAKNLAKELGLAQEGYRIVMNCNENGGQTVYHIHMHLLGGRQMVWPPG
ncbi:MAG: histidine triad nucleotide-binding protein [Pseudomonadales bacterium]|nr:histidine triad nucleotide-binding protein [Pseudomonadales bacterium]